MFRRNLKTAAAAVVTIFVLCSMFNFCFVSDTQLTSEFELLGLSDEFWMFLENKARCDHAVRALTRARARARYAAVSTCRRLSLLCFQDVLDSPQLLKGFFFSTEMNNY